MKSLLSVFAGAVLFAGLASAQNPTGSVSVSVSGTVVTATIGDITCIFYGPTTTDDAIIKCYTGSPTHLILLKFTGLVPLHAGVPVTGLFQLPGKPNNIGWTLERVGTGPGSKITFDISTDGVHSMGVF
jgi:hypothetical protein